MTEPATVQLSEASVALLLEHRQYPGCTMASLTIRERLEVIEAEAARPAPEDRAEGLDVLAMKAEEYLEAVTSYLDSANQFTDSRRHHLDRTGEELAELVAARLTPDRTPTEEERP